MFSKIRQIGRFWHFSYFAGYVEWDFFCDSQTPWLFSHFLSITIIFKKIFAKSALEKRDVDELEGGTDTHKLFLEQGTLEEKKQKELAEYIDAKNKEVIMTN